MECAFDLPNRGRVDFLSLSPARQTMRRLSAESAGSSGPGVGSQSLSGGRPAPGLSSRESERFAREDALAMSCASGRSATIR
jgi:hypothetical protein